MRVFAALPLPRSALDRLGKISEQLADSHARLKVVKPEGMHITLFFFGEIGSEQALELMQIMDDPELRVASIQAEMGGVGQFPPKGEPRVLYCPIRKGAPQITHLHGILSDLLAGVAGLKPESERRFTPHVTVARVRFERGRRSGGERIQISDVEELFRFEHSLILDRLVLFQSILRPQGAEYKVLKTVGLR